MKQRIPYCAAIAVALLLPAGRAFADEAFLKATEARTRELHARLKKLP